MRFSYLGPLPTGRQHGLFGLSTFGSDGLRKLTRPGRIRVKPLLVSSEKRSLAGSATQVGQPTEARLDLLVLGRRCMGGPTEKDSI